MRSLSRPGTLAALLLAAACAQGAPQREMRALEPSLAVGPERAYVAWHGGLDEGSAIFVQQLDADERPVGEAVKISDGDALAYEPDLIVADGRPVVAWYQKDPATGRLSAWLAGLTPTGKRAWLASLAADQADARNPVVRLVGNALEAAWIEQPAADDRSNRATVWHRRFALDGKAEGPPRPIGEANRDTWNLNAAVADDRFVVVYDAALGSKAHELQMLAVGRDGIEHRLLSADDCFASLYPDLQINQAGQAALTWFDERDGNQEVYLAAAPFRTFAQDEPPPAHRVTHSKGASTGAYVAWNGRAIGLAWIDEENGGRDVFGQTFSASGEALAPPRDLGSGPNEAGVPAIRPRGAGFLVAWNDYAIEGGGAHMHVTKSDLRFALLPVSDRAPAGARATGANRASAIQAAAAGTR